MMAPDRFETYRATPGTNLARVVGLSIDHTGRVYLVSGGTSGLGLATARRLVADGAQVWVLGTTAAGVSASGIPGSVCDVTDEAQVIAAVAACKLRLRRLDGAFVNAGIDGAARPATELDVAHFRRVLDVNVTGSFLVAREVARSMIAANEGGVLVLNASVNALRPEAHFIDYNASKAAVTSLAKSLTLELAPKGIAVHCVAPGYFPTRMTEPYLLNDTTAEELRSLIPAGRFGQPEELAALVSYLLTPEAVFLTGGLITIDGGRNI